MRIKIADIGGIPWHLLPISHRLHGVPDNFACRAHAPGTRACLVTRLENLAKGFE
jgi:hypothetical protein